MTQPEQVRAIGFIHQRFRLGAQIVITLAFGVIGCWVVNYVNKYMLGFIFCMGPSQFLAAFLTLGFGMVGVYFSWVAPTFVGFLADVGLLNLELGYPSRTRGIREMNFSSRQVCITDGPYCRDVNFFAILGI